MRRHGKVDANQKEIIQALRHVGAGVQSLANIGGGCPDLLVGFRQNNYLLEVKDGAKPPSARKLTTDQVWWHEIWPGKVCVVKDCKQALKAIGVRHG